MTGMETEIESEKAKAEEGPNHWKPSQANHFPPFWPLLVIVKLEEVGPFPLLFLFILLHTYQTMPD